MSARVLSNNHINVLANFSNAENLQVYHNGEVHSHAPEEIGQLLAEENVKSVNWRYGVDYPCEYQHHWTERSRYSYVQIIKLAHCYEYQSCEHPGWQDSLAAAYIELIVWHATRNLPGYDKAVWELP